MRGGQQFKINKILTFRFVLIVYKTQSIGIVADTPKVFLQNPSLNFVDIDFDPIITFFQNSDYKTPDCVADFLKNREKP